MDDENTKSQASALSSSPSEGVQIAGDVTTGEGDFIGRDQMVYGDEVGQDKVELSYTPSSMLSDWPL